MGAAASAAAECSPGSDPGFPYVYSALVAPRYGSQPWQWTRPHPGACACHAGRR